MNTSIQFPALSGRWLGVLYAALGACVLAVSAPTAGEAKHSDRSFIEKAAKAGQKEMQISQIAAERASNPRIRDFAQQIVRDDRQMNNDLSGLASTKGVALAVNEFKLEKWSAKQSTEFDKDYVREMAGDNDDTISLFEKAAKSDDADIAGFAQKYLPKLQAHLTAAKDFKKMY